MPTLSPDVYLLGQEVFKWWPHIRHGICKTGAADARRAFLAEDHYLQAVGLWTGEMDKGDDEGFALPYAFGKRQYQIVDVADTTTGYACWKVTDDQRDQIWLDPLLNWSPRKRIWQSVTSKAQSRTAIVYEMSDFRQVAGVEKSTDGEAAGH